MLDMDKQFLQKYYPLVSALVVAVLVALTALGILPQKVGISLTFAVLGGTNLILAVTVWKKGRKVEAGFLGTASLILIAMIVVYGIIG